MEDSHIANLNLGDGNSFFGVFDGHGGKKNHIFLSKNHIFFNFIGQEVALYVKKYYCKEFVKLASYKSK